LIQQPAGAQGWKQGGYIDHIPNDPWGNAYQYRQPGQHNPEGFDVFSTGPDGRDGGGDDIGNWADDAHAAKK
jgi:general secretion pathway protein G